MPLVLLLGSGAVIGALGLSKANDAFDSAAALKGVPANQNTFVIVTAIAATAYVVAKVVD